MNVATSILCQIAIVAIFLCQLPAASGQEEFAPERLAQKCPYTSQSDCKDMCDWLDLTGAQLVKMNDIKSKYMEENCALKGKKKVLRRKIADLMTQPELNRDEVTKLHTQLNDIRTNLSTSRLNCFMDSVEVLDADQKKKIRRKMLKHMLFSRCGFKRSWHKCKSDYSKNPATAASPDQPIISGLF